MCKHVEIIVASRNAVVALRASLGVEIIRFEKEFSRREVAYDSLLMDIEKKCVSCEADKQDPKRKSDYLRFVDEYVTHFDGGTCEFC